MRSMEHPLRAYRKKTGLTLEQLGAAVGVTKGFISKIESGAVPSLRVAMKISEFSKGEIKPDDLIRSQDAPSPFTEAAQ
jgi:transcriptional regulator with XRE-family HTH domain